jgi:D-alanyl-D-alanine carboxypeptidase
VAKRRGHRNTKFLGKRVEPDGVDAVLGDDESSSVEQGPSKVTVVIGALRAGPWNGGDPCRRHRPSLARSNKFRHDVSMTNNRAMNACVAIFAVLGLVFAAGSCTHTPEVATEKLDAALQKVVREDDDVFGAVVAVDAPKLGLSYEGAAGLAQVDAGVPMTTSTAFLSASVGKLLVAATVLSLAGANIIDLDAPLSRYVDLEQSGARDLPVRGGNDALAAITVRQLLTHKSGLPDYFSDASRDGAPRLFDLIVDAPERTFTRADLFSYCRDHFDAVGAPGTVFHYADTNFDLLGLVLEGATGAARYTDVVRTRVLEPLGLTHTWAHSEAAPVDVVVADVYVRGKNLRDAPALSADQAGGGYITTLADLRAFMRGLLRGNPVSLDELGGDFTLDAMHAGIDVGGPLWRIRPGGVFFALASQPTLLGHSGATGVWAYVAEGLDAVIVGAVSTSAWQEKHVEFLLSDVVPVLQATVPPPR